MGKRKYPWDSLKSIGDTFHTDSHYSTVNTSAISAGKYRDKKYSVKKIKGGTLVTRVA